MSDSPRYHNHRTDITGRNHNRCRQQSDSHWAKGTAVNISRGQTLTGSIEHVESLVAESLSSFLDIENSRHRGFYETMSKGRATEIYIFGFEGEVFFKLRRFVPSFLGGKTRVNIERMDCPGKCPTIVALLASNAPYKFVQANPSYWKEHGDVAFLRHLIDLPPFTGPLRM